MRIEEEYCLPNLPEVGTLVKEFSDWASENLFNVTFKPQYHPLDHRLWATTIIIRFQDNEERLYFKLLFNEEFAPYLRNIYWTDEFC